MKLETNEVLVRFGIEKSEYKKRLNGQFQFLIGKYFGLKGKEERSKDRYCGLIESVNCSEDYNGFTSEYRMKLEISYKNKNDEEKNITVVFEDKLFLTKNRILVYGDDEESVKLELMCTEK